MRIKCAGERNLKRFQLSILPEPQQALWPTLGQVPKRFVLYGGTAIALRLGHRDSVDFDFFTSDDFNSDQLVREMDFLAGSKRAAESPNTLTVRQALDNRSPGIMDERSVAYWDLVLPQYSGKKNPICFPK